MDKVEIMWLPETGWNKFRYGNTWHAFPGKARQDSFSENTPLCKLKDTSDLVRGRVWNKPWSKAITWVCEKCQRQMTVWDMAE